MGEAKRRRATNAKPKIERAALELFVKRGIDAATTREIAERAGVSEGALYRHYKGKDELALALFMEAHNELGDTLLKAWAQGRDMEDKVRRSVTAYCGFVDEDRVRATYHIQAAESFGVLSPFGRLDSVVRHDLCGFGDAPPIYLPILMFSPMLQSVRVLTAPMTPISEMFARAALAIAAEFGVTEVENAA